jgi:hypothetical protein
MPRDLHPQRAALVSAAILPGAEPAEAGSCTAADGAHQLTNTPNVQLCAGLLKAGIDLVPAPNGGIVRLALAD